MEVARARFEVLGRFVQSEFQSESRKQCMIKRAFSRRGREKWRVYEHEKEEVAQVNRADHPSHVERVQTGSEARKWSGAEPVWWARPAVSKLCGSRASHIGSGMRMPEVLRRKT
jgi:hypothetical protein